MFKNDATVHVETADFIIMLNEEQRIAYRGKVMDKLAESDWVLTPLNESPYTHHMVCTVENPNAPENNGDLGDSDDDFDLDNF